MPAGVLQAVVAACLACGCSGESGDRPPNLVLISLDNLGAAHVGAYGSARSTTPFLDELAERGVVFENAHAQATWTLPSHSSMLSSRYVGAHGAWKVERRFPPGPVLLPEVLGDAGWQTAAFTSCDFVSPLYGLDRGFGRMEAMLEPAERITAQAVEQLQALDDGPFLLFLHYFDVHQPFNEGNPYGEDFAEGLEQAALEEAQRMVGLMERDASSLTEEEIAWLAGLFPGRRVRWHVQRAVEEQTVLDDRLMKLVRQYLTDKGEHALDVRRAQYDNGVANMDRQLAELFEELETFPWFEDTVFVITADHGESFNDPPGVIGHGGPPYREQTHVPLIVFGAGIPQGERVTTPVGSIDIAPTLLELAAVPTPDGFQGRSLVPALRGGGLAEQPILSGELRAGSVSVRMGDWTLLIDRRGEVTQLFDAREPGRADASAARPDLVEKLRGWLRDIEERNALLTVGLEPHDVQLDPEVRQRLVELGYLK